jgi:hypothetical protein
MKAATPLTRPAQTTLCTPPINDSHPAGCIRPAHLIIPIFSCPKHEAPHQSVTNENTAANTARREPQFKGQTLLVSVLGTPLNP